MARATPAPGTCCLPLMRLSRRPSRPVQSHGDRLNLHMRSAARKSCAFARALHPYAVGPIRSRQHGSQQRAGFRRQTTLAIARGCSIPRSPGRDCPRYPVQGRSLLPRSNRDRLWESDPPNPSSRPHMTLSFTIFDGRNGPTSRIP